MNLNKKQLIIVLVLAVVVVGALIWGVSAMSKARTEYEASLPTPTPTSRPVQDVYCKGGQIFLNDPDVQQILRERYGYNVTTEYMGSFDQVAPDMDYTGIDCIWPGSAAAYAEFQVNHPGLEMDHETVFKTLLMAFLRTQYLEEALRSGIVEKQGNAYVFDMEGPACAMLNEQTWADLGAPGIPGYVNFRGSAPESSGGGRATLFLEAAFLTPGDLPREVRVSDLNKVVECNGEPTGFTMLQAIEQLWLVSGQQSDSSPENWEDFAMIPWPWAISSESLFIGSYNSQTPEVQQAFLDQFVGVYPSYTLSTDHVYIALTPAGVEILDAFRTDPDLQNIGWEKYGMRIGIQGIGQTPGGIAIEWFLENPIVMPDPKTDVSDAVKELLSNH